MAAFCFVLIKPTFLSPNIFDGIASISTIRHFFKEAAQHREGGKQNLPAGKC